MAFEIKHGDCLEVMRGMPDNSVDAVVTDPPYGLSFMGKKWDYDVPATEVWAECLRVLKPGGHLLAFAGTRTQHRMAVRIEDAGFDIRDMIAWVYGSGFPKSHNGPWGGTALKPALEPVTFARKPLAGTVADNVLRYGTGGLNIDGCRVEIDGPAGVWGAKQSASMGYHGGTEGSGYATSQHPAGRWPSNLIHDGSDEVTALFPHTKVAPMGPNSGFGSKNCFGGGWNRASKLHHGSSEGSAARFFYCAKASKRDRDEGLSNPATPFVQFQTGNGASGKPSSLSEGRNTEYRNHHPTVKPTDLMRYLCRLVTPPGGTVLDPFTGSGSTGKAAMLEGFNFIGIEREAGYVAIAEARIAEAQRSLGLFA